MGRKKLYIALISLLAFAGTSVAQNYFDDVYYNPKKDTSSTTSTATKQKQQSYYIADMGNMDVDTYNRRGNQYFVSQIDTIGSVVENGEDFVYTQQIQKYYNPTIVVDNANVLGDVLSNAYGNVDIIINDNGYPVFAPYYGWNWNWPYYSSIWSPWSWNLSFGGWGWSVGWYDPWLSWGWGPGWWNPGPAWGWGPAWRPGPGWGPGHGPGWGPGWGPGPGPMASWNPRGNRPVAPRPGWSNTAQRPAGNMQMTNRPVGNYRGGANAGVAQRPMQSTNGRPTGVVNNNGKWQYNTTATTGHRTAGTGVLPSKTNQSQPAVGNNRTSTSNSKSNNTITNTNRNNTTNRSTISNSRSNIGTGSIGSGSRSTGGRSTGGRGVGGGGRHR